MATTATKTAGELCTKALRLAGITAKDEPADASDMSEAILSLDMMLKAWQLPGYRVFERLTGSITVTDATSSYAITERPLRLQTVNWKDTSGNETWLYQMSGDEYDELSNKDSAGRATQFFYNRVSDSGTLIVWPVLGTAAGETLEWTGQREIEDITANTDSVQVPSEHYLGIVYNLAEILLDEFDVADPVRTTKIVTKAAELKADIFGYEREDSFYFSPDMAGR